MSEIRGRWESQRAGFAALRELPLAKADQEARELIQMHDDIGVLLTENEALRRQYQADGVEKAALAAQAQRDAEEVARLSVAYAERGGLLHQIRHALADGGLMGLDLVPLVQRAIEERAQYSRNLHEARKSLRLALDAPPPPPAEAERAVVEAALVVQEYMGRWANTSSTWKEFYEACDHLRSARAAQAQPGEENTDA